MLATVSGYSLRGNEMGIIENNKCAFRPPLDFAGIARLLFSIMMLMVISLPLAHAQASFDHYQTGFPLTGMHARTDCESCHVAGIFKGTPRQCKYCHSRATHISLTVPPMDTVHNMNQQADCDTCHRTSAGWASARFEHLGITSGCLRCHRAGGAGRPAPVDAVHRQAPGAECSNCHRSTDSFASGALLDHSGFSSGCEAVGCHASDKARARAHALLTGCQDCHSYPSWSNVRMNHNLIGATQCRACHVRGGNAMGPPADQLHAGIGTTDCSACHDTIDFGSATVDHSLISSGCGVSGCHAADRTRAANHAALSTCESCHSYPDWLNVSMDHSAIGATQCRSCHAVGGTATAPPSDATHAGIGTTDCSVCHHSTTTFTGAVGVDHSQITSGCNKAGCHAADQASAPSPHVTLNSCQSCHRYPSWTNVTMNHSAIGSTRCSSCHLYGSSAGLGRGAPNDSRHRSAQSSGYDCNRCHGTRSFD